MTHRSVKWHENNVLRMAIRFSDTFVLHVGYGGPVAKAAALLNNAVEQLQAARRKPTPRTPGEKQDG